MSEKSYFTMEDGRLFVTALCVTDEAGVLRLKVGDMFFEQRIEDVSLVHPGIPEQEVVPSESEQKRKEPVDKGEIVTYLSGQPIFKNVLDDCRHAKTYAEMFQVIQKYYPNFQTKSVESYKSLYRRAIAQGTPSVPMREKPKHAVHHNGRRTTPMTRTTSYTVEWKKGATRPEGTLFYDKVKNIWIKAETFHKVKDWMLSQESFTSRQMYDRFWDVPKQYVMSVLHRLLDLHMVTAESGGKNIFRYSPVDKKPGFPETLVTKVEHSSLMEKAQDDEGNDPHLPH